LISVQLYNTIRDRWP